MMTKVEKKTKVGREVELVLLLVLVVALGGSLAAMREWLFGT